MYKNKFPQNVIAIEKSNQNGRSVIEKLESIPALDLDIDEEFEVIITYGGQQMSLSSIPNETYIIIDESNQSLYQLPRYTFETVFEPMTKAESTTQSKDDTQQTNTFTSFKDYVEKRLKEANKNIPSSEALADILNQSKKELKNKRDALKQKRQSQQEKETSNDVDDVAQTLFDLFGSQDDTHHEQKETNREQSQTNRNDNIDLIEAILKNFNK